MASSVSLGWTITLMVDVPKEALDRDLAPLEFVPGAAPAPPLPMRLVPAALSCGLPTLAPDVAVRPGLAVASGACVVSGVLRKLSQANVAQAAISTQRYLKGLSPDFCKATLKLTAIDYTG